MPSAWISYQKPHRHTLPDGSWFLLEGLAVDLGCMGELVHGGLWFAGAAVFADSAGPGLGEDE